MYTVPDIEESIATINDAVERFLNAEKFIVTQHSGYSNSFDMYSCRHMKQQGTGQ